MRKEPSEKKSRLEFTAKFVETVKATDKEQRFTDAKTPGLEDNLFLLPVNLYMFR